MIKCFILHTAETHLKTRTYFLFPLSYQFGAKEIKTLETRKDEASKHFQHLDHRTVLNVLFYSYPFKFYLSEFVCE